MSRRMMVDLSIHIPEVPNFIQLEGGSGKIPLSKFAEAELREIGSAWTDDLVARANEMREPTE